MQNHKPQHLNVQKKDLSQFIENITDKEESKFFDSITNDVSNKFGKQDYQSQSNQDNLNWYELRLQGKCPERRAYHTSFSYGKKQGVTIVKNNYRMFIFGGHDIKEGSLDSLWMIELGKLNESDKHEDHQQYEHTDKKIEWTKLETFGNNKPGEISHHSSIVFGEKMYLFGGSSSAYPCFPFYSLDLKSLKWEVINSRGEVPVTRDDHTAVLYEGSMVIFGGFVDGERTNDIYRYYFKDNKWEKVAVLGMDAPLPRAGHSALVYADSMVIFGGRDEDNNKLNDLWLFNFTSYQWEYQDVLDAPMARSGHSASLYKDMMLIFGGIFEVTRELDDMHLYDFRNKRWIEFFEEACSPLKLKQSLSSPDGSPKSKVSGGKLRQESFKLDFTKQITQGPNNYNSIGSPNRSINKGRINNPRFSIRKGENSLLNINNQSASKISPTSKNRASTTTGAVRRKRTVGRTGGYHLSDKDRDTTIVQLESPTSISMKNSFIIKNADPSFEVYYNSMRKRRNNITQSFMGNSSVAEGVYGKVSGKRPAARDGQSGIVFQDYFIVFGGDRHHMPFNDTFLLDLRKEFIMRSHIFH